MEGHVKRMFRLARFFDIKTNKKTKLFDLQDEIQKKIIEWEEENKKPFPY